MMKNRKILAITWALLLCLSVFVMCFNGATHDVKRTGYFCYVQAVTPDGFTFQFRDAVGGSSSNSYSDEYVFIECDTQRYAIDTYDTIFVIYDSAVMYRSSGTVKTWWGKEIRYTYVVPATQLIRHAKRGEPVFG